MPQRELAVTQWKLLLAALEIDDMMLMESYEIQIITTHE
jgi:hypothetical protein